MHDELHSDRCSSLLASRDAFQEDITDLFEGARAGTTNPQEKEASDSGDSGRQPWEQDKPSALGYRFYALPRNPFNS